MFGIDEQNIESASLSISVYNWNGGSETLIGKVNQLKASPRVSLCVTRKPLFFSLCVSSVELLQVSLFAQIFVHRTVPFVCAAIKVACPGYDFQSFGLQAHACLCVQVIEVARAGNMEEWFDLRDERGALVQGANNERAR